MWKWRGLSLSGKIQVVKTFAIPKVTRNGKEKVKCHALISDIKEGGLRMLDIESLIKVR